MAAIYTHFTSDKKIRHTYTGITEILMFDSKATGGKGDLKLLPVPKDTVAKNMELQNLKSRIECN